MARCFNKYTGKYCPHLSFNTKGNFVYHCGYNPERLVQVCEIDLEKNYPCPLDIGIKVIKEQENDRDI
ncbi:MAG: hypothetical protein AABY07_10880 [Nanoarchaeota archaeon]